MDSSSETDFLVYADGVWRSVELRSGRVQGWARRARFAVLSGGALRLLQRARVLRALRDLRDGKESCVRAGRELHRVHRRSRDRRPRRRTTLDHRSPPSPLKPTQPPTNPPVKPSIPLKPAPPKASPPTVPIKSSPITAPVKPVSKSMVQSPKPREETERVKKPVRAATPAESTGSTDGVCELEVSESTVTALRSFLAKHAHSPNTPPALRGADVRLFDRDEEYRRSVLFRVQPLVRLVRCAHVARLLRDGKRLVDVRPGGATLAHFTSQLGLKRRPRARPRPRVLQDTSSSSDYSLQKLRDELKSPERRAVIGREERAPRPPRPAPPRPPSPKTIRATQGRDYSSLEDQCIVCWVSAGPEREHAVKGNRLWRELEEHFPRLSGHARTYHSLRNRYLRYLLPGLARLAVPLEQARRMRAAAATGNIKYRETLRGAPPAAPAPPPAGAWARRPRPRPRAASPTPPPQPRPSPDTETTTGRRRSARLTPQPPLPSPPPPAAPQPPGPRPESPLSYAEVTRRFARKHQKTSTPASSPASGSSVPAPEAPAPPRTRRLYNPR